jgi:hypothetical protein
MKELIEKFKKLQGDSSPTIGNELVFRDISSDIIYIKPFSQANKLAIDRWVKNNSGKWSMVSEEEFKKVIELSTIKSTKNAINLDSLPKVDLIQEESKEEVVIEETNTIEETKVEAKKRGRKAK